MKTSTNPFAALGLALRKSVEIPAYKDGWRTTKEVTKETGWGVATTQKNLKEGVAKGMVEYWTGYVPVDGNRQRRKQAKYRFVGKKK